MGSSESKAKGSFGQKEFDILNMGETALEEAQRSTKHYDFSKNKSSTNFII
jgi:hypothetical protein